MGVTSVLVENGVNLDMFKLGLSNFATNFAASSRNQDEKPQGESKAFKKEL